ITLICFTPVIYWNATHDWMSFAFQSTRRFQGKFYFSLHELLGLLVLFLTPIGFLGLITLWKKEQPPVITPPTQRFIRYYTIIPLLVFGLFSISREIKLNWIGPSILALIPWLSAVMNQQFRTLKQWFYLSPVLLMAYIVLFIGICFGQPAFLNQLFLNKMISWENVTKAFYQIAAQIAATGETPVFVPLDTYSIASELAFYQAKQAVSHPERPPFLIHDATLFDFDGLMFKFWSSFDLNDKKIILIGKEMQSFDNDLVLALTQPLSPIQTVWGESQGLGKKIRPYYYRIIRIKT
ncbi:MAG TPA: hypothetical protein VHD33_05740, partial [Legionellaceae bacterium]|nr:hypothetical protein [Legionellaceae bacterium]